MSSRVAAYFIGGPLDLTKTMLPGGTTPPVLYTAGAVAYSHIDFASAERHVYRRREAGRVYGERDFVVLYLYEGRGA